jgi:hypothetical protein
MRSVQPFSEDQMDTIETKNRRQRIDDAEAELANAHQSLGASKAKQMRLLGDIGDAQAKVEASIDRVKRAEEALQAAIEYRDAPADPAGAQLLFGRATTDMTLNGGTPASEAG